MSLDSTDQALADVEEQTELSTSSEDQQPEADAEEVSESTEEPQEAQEEAAQESTEPKPKKPRKPRQKSQMREMEDRILNAVDERLSQAVPPPDKATENANANANANAVQNNPGAQLLRRRTTQFNQELTDLRASHDQEEQAIARTIDDGIAGRNALSDIDSSVVQQLLMDGITPDELHDLNENYGDKLVPQAPEVEYRTIKRYLRQIRGGTAKETPQTGKTVRKPHRPVTTVPGTGAGLRSPRTAQAAEDRFRGKS